MPVTYTYEGTLDTIEIDFTNQEINIGSAFDELEVQEINDAIREAEATAVGCAFPRIIDTSGKENLDLDSGVSVGITLELLDDWKVYSEKTSGTFKVWGGNLLRSDGEDPFKANTLITYIAILSAASTLVQVSTGSGLSTEEHNKLMGIPSNPLTKERYEDLAFRRGNTTSGTGQNKKITRYVAGDPLDDPVTVDVSYDDQDDPYGLPVSEVPQ